MYTIGMETDFFESAGFVHSYGKELMRFYRPFFPSDEAMTSFFVRIIQYEITREAEGDGRYIPRRMMNQIRRFVSLANDIEQIRPGRDPLKILFFRVCLESLRSLSGGKKEFFTNIAICMSDEGTAYITDHFRLMDWMVDSTESPFVHFPQDLEIRLSLDDFFKIIWAVRNLSVHEGDYWSMVFFSDAADCPCITTLTTKDTIISSVKPNGKKITYVFETSLDYRTFTHHFVQMCIAYVEEYMHTHLLKT